MKKLNDTRASSLVEVMVAAAVMVIVFSGLIQVFLTSSVLSDSASNLSLGVNEAQAKLEEIRSSDYDDIVSDYTTTCECADGIDNDTDSNSDFFADTECMHYFDDDESDSAENRSSCSGTFTLNQLNGSGTVTMTMIYPETCSTQCLIQLVEISVTTVWTNDDGRTASTTVAGYMARRN